jgi:hypothetical protein
MFISLREAGDLCLQMVLALALILGGMALASTVVKATEQRVAAIDVNRPLLWSAGPVRVESIQLFAGRELAAGDGTGCHDAIGLRISCDLATFSSSSNF